MPTGVNVNAADLARLLGGKLKRIRESKRMQITELALISGISRAYLSKIESGSRNIRVDTLIRLSLALKIKPSALLP